MHSRSLHNACAIASHWHVCIIRDSFLKKAVRKGQFSLHEVQRDMLLSTQNGAEVMKNHSGKAKPTLVAPKTTGNSCQFYLQYILVCAVQTQDFYWVDQRG